MKPKRLKGWVCFKAQGAVHFRGYIHNVGNKTREATSLRCQKKVHALGLQKSEEVSFWSANLTAARWCQIPKRLQRLRNSSSKIARILLILLKKIVNEVMDNFDIGNFDYA